MRSAVSRVLKTLQRTFQTEIHREGRQIVIVVPRSWNGLHLCGQSRVLLHEVCKRRPSAAAGIPPACR